MSLLVFLLTLKHYRKLCGRCCDFSKSLLAFYRCWFSYRVWKKPTTIVIAPRTNFAMDIWNAYIGKRGHTNVFLEMLDEALDVMGNDKKEKGKRIAKCKEIVDLFASKGGKFFKWNETDFLTSPEIDKETVKTEYSDPFVTQSRARRNKKKRKNTVASFEPPKRAKLTKDADADADATLASPNATNTSTSPEDLQTYLRCQAPVAVLRDLGMHLLQHAAANAQHFVCYLRAHFDDWLDQAAMLILRAEEEEQRQQEQAKNAAHHIQEALFTLETVDIQTIDNNNNNNNNHPVVQALRWCISAGVADDFLQSCTLDLLAGVLQGTRPAVTLLLSWLPFSSTQSINGSQWKRSKKSR